MSLRKYSGSRSKTPVRHTPLTVLLLDGRGLSVFRREFELRQLSKGEFMVRKFSAVSCLLLVSSFLSVTSAIAQSSSGGEESAGGLQEIVVTATRREESSQRAALAIQPITAEELSRAG